ncbi:MAG: RNase P subunit p30 family protein [Candidatus Altiarchaeota archaeon]
MKKTGYWDLNVSGKEIQNTISTAQTLGFTGICVGEKFSDLNRFKDQKKEFSVLQKKSPIEILIGACIEIRTEGEIQKKARNAFDCGADLVFFKPKNVDENRLASECWEIDVLSPPHDTSARDFMNQREAGIDKVCAKNMAERSIALEVSLAQILDSNGRKRAELLGRISQNLKVAKKYKTQVIFTSGAIDPLGMRSPQDFSAILKVLGADEKQAKDIITSNVEKIIQKSHDRNDPDVILKGLKVIDWGKQKPQEPKKKYGWY